MPPTDLYDLRLRREVKQFENLVVAVAVPFSNAPHVLSEPAIMLFVCDLHVKAN